MASDSNGSPPTSEPSSPVWAERFRKLSRGLTFVTISLGTLCILNALICRFQGGTGLPLPGAACLPETIGLSFVLVGLGALSTRKTLRNAYGTRRAATLQSFAGAPVFVYGIMIATERVTAGVDLLTGLLFILLGTALGLEGFRLKGFGYARQLALFATFFISGLVLFSHIYEFPTHRVGMIDYLQINWTTALIALVAGHALLFQHPNFGVMRLLSADAFGGHMLRRLVPSVVLVLGGLGWFITYGKSHAWYPAAFGEGLFALLAMGGFSIVLFIVAEYLNRIDTERSDRERRLKRSEDELRAVLDNTGAIICMKDLEGRYMLVNESFCRLTGMAGGDASGKSAADIFPEAVAEVIEAGHREALRKQAPVEHIDDIIYANESRCYLSTNIPLFDGDGKLYAVCGVYTDVTELKNQKQEILRLNASLREETQRQAEANAELESFSYSVSHDLRAPLRHIAGFAQLLGQRNQAHLDEKSRHYLEVIQESVGRMGNLIDDLLSFSRAGKVAISRRRVRTGQLVQEVCEELMLHHAGPAVEWRIGALPDMHGDPALLRLVWTNLLSNAIKYSSRREAPCVEVGHEPATQGTPAFYVRDNGAGFDMQYVDKLFGVFQRLHSSKDFQGTGIGLALVRRIIERHGGTIWAEAAPDAGACFYFVLPENPTHAGPEAGESEKGAPHETP